MGGRRSSVASYMGREKPPSKDGTAQRRAKEVEGLKDFVGHVLIPNISGGYITLLEAGFRW